MAEQYTQMHQTFTLPTITSHITLQKMELAYIKKEESMNTRMLYLKIIQQQIMEE